ncbi:hypothetical protein E2P71_04930 [Candidatus Bathyarchaeota archaeon]|nr:hypothetical protein E2P71_04930 [Candidatus Bathyarchaeota archaeon]
MISYIKLYGPPIYEAVKALEKIAIGMPEVCIMDTMIAASIPASGLGTDDRMGGTTLIPGGVYNYFLELGEVTRERCDNIISKSGEELGQHDFYFEWFTKPDMKQMNDLIKAIDKALVPIGVRYTITTK